MFELALSLALSIQSQPTTRTDLPPAPPPARAQSTPKRKKIYVRDSSKAAKIEVDDPMQEICVRTPVVGSRVKVRTVCQDQAAWKAYLLAQDAMAQEWDKADPGVPVI
ncbi:hypothetical protein [Parerythrobacter jejuensis]|uniref:Uncharacterized protein n=1 Tax=Parerythrobacter jejuensis TaxID=795812 RepID=A0A845APF4_9SPHN|nr:hypothetical protein [Parerythrobacter jejuensis]MXP31494.1 hypothetical protein [Parerythrobacter jejuensis]